MNDDLAIHLGAIGYLLLGMLGLLLLCSPILVPLLYKTRLVVRLVVKSTGGEPLAGFPIEGVRNRTGRATQTTGEGLVTAEQLYAVRTKLGVTDASGRFERTYYLRNFHTLWLGPREMFVTPELKEKMRARDHEVVVNPQAGGAAGPASGADDWTARFSGKAR